MDYREPRLTVFGHAEIVIRSSKEPFVEPDLITVPGNQMF